MTPSSKGLILVVDDEFAIAETLRDLLEAEGYRVVIASNGRDALDHATREPPVLVLTDLMMPMLGGVELVAALRADPALKAIPILMMSSAPRASTVKAVLDRGDIAAFFRKPFDLDLLLGTIEKLLAPKP